MIECSRTIITVHARHCRGSVHLRRQAVTIPTAAGDRFTVVATCSVLSAVRTACLVVRVSVLSVSVTSGYVRSSCPGRPIFTLILLFLLSIAVGQSKRVFPESYAGYDEQNGRTQVRSAAGAVRRVRRVDENDGRRLAAATVGQTQPSQSPSSSSGKQSADFGWRRTRRG